MVVPFPTLRYSRPMSSPKGDGVSFSLYPPYPRSMKHRRDVKNAAERQNTRWVLVGGTPFQVPESFFALMPQRLRDKILFTLGGGVTSEKPIRLGRHSSLEFGRLLDAFNAYNYKLAGAKVITTEQPLALDRPLTLTRPLMLDRPLKPGHPLTLEHLLTLGSFACVYQMRAIQQWFLPLFRDLVFAPASPLLDPAHDRYVYLMRIALSYRDTATTDALTLRWVAKLHLGALAPLPAIGFAELHGLTFLLAHAYYVYLMTVARDIQHGRAFGAPGAPAQCQRTHILAGYHSLRTYWRALSADAPVFDAADGCATHGRCLQGWRTRWPRLAARPCALPEVDVIGRTLVIEKALTSDGLLNAYMAPSCKARALKAVAAKRDRISKQLHHHFDL